MAEICEGKLPQPTKLLITFNIEPNPVGNANAITLLLSAASPQTDALMTSPGIVAEESEMTLPGVDEEVEGKHDHQSEQAEVEFYQLMSSVESEHTNSQLLRP